MNPYELIYLCILQDPDAFMELWDLYEPIARNTYYSMLAGCRDIQLDDFLQESREILWECIFRYRTDLQVPFPRFLSTSIHNRAKQLLRGSTRALIRAQGEPLSLDYVGKLEDRSQYEVLHQEKVSLEEQILEKLSFSILMEKLKAALSPRDGQVLDMYYAGYRKTDIARILNLSYRQVDHAFLKSRKVLQVDTLMQES